MEVPIISGMSHRFDKATHYLQNMNMKSPETTVAIISFAPSEFEAMKAAFENLKGSPQRQLEHDELWASFVLGNWRGASETDVQEQLKAREDSREPLVRYGGSVIAGSGFRPIRAHLSGEHPVIKAAREVVKFGPPTIKVLEGSVEHWRLEGHGEESIQRIRGSTPDMFEDSYDSDVLELDDPSQGTGLVMRAINVRTAKAALGAYALPPLVTNGPRFDIGLVIDTAQRKQDVQVSIFEREGDNPSSMQEHLVEQLPHIRAAE